MEAAIFVFVPSPAQKFSYISQGSSGEVKGRFPFGHISSDAISLLISLTTVWQLIFGHFGKEIFFSRDRLN